eukprot:TRINITY_DN39897_c0_g1_i1.p1 TRINITY_DN39897_c0_g1~~TRINITY_DN39897_c0_g1_i1.p1  ORF type:complete len:563 (+),score=49.23 TRINITY_DN39897_c0_g1_i1:35-1690(+)
MEYTQLSDPPAPNRRRCTTEFGLPAITFALCLGACALLFACQCLGRPTWDDSTAALRTELSGSGFGTRTQVDVVLEPGMIVRGVSSAEIGQSFYGIPYARAGRWEDPQTVRWQGIHDATLAGNSCKQTDSPRSSEDCLNLDVITPPFNERTRNSTRRPVFVWFFGGGYLGGSASDFKASGIFPADKLVSRGLVMVIPNFRLGVFGYLGSDRARRNSTGNWGVLDQVMSLKWVSANIHAFGGDPTRVTVGGWSSGAASISAILTMDSSKDLMQAAVMMSGGFTDWAVFSLESAEPTYDALLKQTGCHLSAECLRNGPPCNCLLNVSAARLATLEENLAWAPVVDGVALPMLPYTALQKGKFHPVPLIIGSTLEDCFPTIPDDATDKDFEAWLRQHVPVKKVSHAYELYLGNRTRPQMDWIHKSASPAHWATQRAVADRGQTCLARRVARHWPVGAWQYHWRTRFKGEDTSGFGPGISHSSDQHFLFQKSMPAEYRPAAEGLQQALALFIKDGSPGDWWPAGGGRGPVFYGSGPVVESIRQEQCDFWDSIDGP